MTVSDSFYSQLSLLLPFDAADGSTTFTDESPFAHTITTSGSPVISSTHSKAGNALYLNGSSNLSITTSPAFALGSLNFAIGVWFWAETQTGSYPCLIERSGAWGAGEWQIMYDHASAPGVFSVWVNSISSSLPILTSTTAPAVGELQHVGLIRMSATELHLCINGVVEDTYTITGNFCGATSEPLRIGNTFKGWIDAPSITKGSNRGLVGDFNPDTAFYSEERFRAGITTTLNLSGDLVGYTHYVTGITDYVDLQSDFGCIRKGEISSSLDLSGDMSALVTALGSIFGVLHLDGDFGAAGRFKGVVSSALALSGGMGRIGRYKASLSDTLLLLDAGISTGDLDSSIDTWVVNANTNAHSRYADFPFNSFAHFDGKVYGCKADGIYELGGDTDGADPIAGSVTPPETDFGSQQLKRVEYVYLGVKAAGTLTVKASPDGDTYAYSADFYGRDSRSARAKLGKGLDGRYWKFELAFVGAPVELDTIHYEYTPLSRRI